MATTLSMQQMMEEILRQDAAKLDLVADTRRMSANVAPIREDGPNEIVLHVDQTSGGIESLVLNSHARGQVATDLGIPKRYFDRMLGEAPDLLRSNVQHWLYANPNRRLVRGFKAEDGVNGTARAWLSDRYRRLDNIEIAKRIFPVFEEIPGLRFHQAQLTDERFYLRAVLPTLEAEIKAGDILQAGVEIKNSEVGSGALAIGDYILRLICTNGMTTNVGVRRNHVGRRIEDETFLSDEAVQADDEALWLVARDTVKSVLQEVRFNEIVSQLRETITGDSIQAPAAATETLAQRYSLSDEEREAVLRNLTQGGDLTRWGALNAVTAAAKEADGFDRQAEMEALGWTIGSLSSKEWASIAVA